MISRKLQNVLYNVGFKVKSFGTKHKNKYEVIYKAPFHWGTLQHDFSGNKNIKNEMYEDSPANVVCHYFLEDNKNDYIDAVIEDIEKYIAVLNIIIEMLRSERE